MKPHALRLFSALLSLSLAPAAAFAETPSNTARPGGKLPGNVAIHRHVKIKGQANPYDPTWEMYFEARLGVKMSATLKGRRQLLYLWKEQNGRCPVCNEKITELTGWHNHHKIWRSHGGSDGVDNRVLLHPTCHMQVHHPHGFHGAPHPVTGVLVAA